MPLLRAFIAAQIERLEGLREEAWEAVDGPEAEAVAAKALMDAGKDAQIRHRYYRDAQLAQQRAAKLLMKVRDRKQNGEPEAPKGTTGAAILEAMRVPARCRGEGRGHRAESASSTRRTEANEAGDRSADRERNSNGNQEMRNEPAGGSAPIPKRTEPGFRPDPNGPNGPDRRPEGPAKTPGSSPRGV